jgi:hypothetical protein
MTELLRCGKLTDARGRMSKGANFQQPLAGEIDSE